MGKCSKDVNEDLIFMVSKWGKLLRINWEKMVITKQTCVLLSNHADSCNQGPETPVSSSSVPMVTIGPVPHTINSHITLLIGLQPTHRAAHRGYLAKTSPVEPLKRSFHCKNQINGGLKMAHEWEIRPRSNSRSKKDITFQSSIVSLAGITDSFQFTI